MNPSSPPDPDPIPNSTADGSDSRTDGSRVTPRFDHIDATSAVRWKALEDLLDARQKNVAELYRNLAAAISRGDDLTASVLRARLEALSASPETLTSLRPPAGECDCECEPAWYGWAWVVCLLLAVIGAETVLIGAQVVFGCEGLLKP